MITDEVVSAERKKVLSSGWTKLNADAFAFSKKENPRQGSIDFYIGFRSAERLAKIEVLEEIVSQFSYMLIDDNEDDYQDGRLSAALDILNTVKDKIKELKDKGV